MASVGLPARVIITGLLMVSMSWPGYCPCPTSARPAAKSESCRTAEKCRCCQTTIGQKCGMACCQKPAPQQNDRQSPTRSDREQLQLAIPFVPSAVLPGDGVGGGSPMAALLERLESRLAPPTLQAQHICMQV
jgi:hypothetical protein